MYSLGYIYVITQLDKASWSFCICVNIKGKSKKSIIKNTLSRLLGHTVVNYQVPLMLDGVIAKQVGLKDKLNVSNDLCAHDFLLVFFTKNLSPRPNL